MCNDNQWYKIIWRGFSSGVTPCRLVHSLVDIYPALGYPFVNITSRWVKCLAKYVFEHEQSHWMSYVDISWDLSLSYKWSGLHKLKMPVESLFSIY